MCTISFFAAKRKIAYFPFKDKRGVLDSDSSVPPSLSILDKTNKQVVFDSRPMRTSSNSSGSTIILSPDIKYPDGISQCIGALVFVQFGCT